MCNGFERIPEEGLCNVWFYVRMVSLAFFTFGKCNDSSVLTWMFVCVFAGSPRYTIQKATTRLLPLTVHTTAATCQHQFLAAVFYTFTQICVWIAKEFGTFFFNSISFFKQATFTMNIQHFDVCDLFLYIFYTDLTTSVTSLMKFKHSLLNAVFIECCLIMVGRNVCTWCIMFEITIFLAWNFKGVMNEWAYPIWWARLKFWSMILCII